MKTFLIILALSFSFVSIAADKSDSDFADACEKKFSPDPKDLAAHEEVLIHPTSYAPEVEQYQKALEVVQDVSKRLGLLRDINHHVLEVMSPRALASLAATNRYPVGSYSDGATIFQSAKSLGGVLEFVLSGKNTQHSYYLSTLSLTQFLSIVIHVYGHNFFHVHSHYPHKTAADRVGASVDLDELMNTLSTRVHPDEVEDWYFYLLSLEHAQDYWSGTYDTPETMVPKSIDDYRAWAGNVVQSSERQTRQTESLLQAFIAELPKGTPEWKVEMAKRVEAMNRFIPGAVNTKVVNEGFATICQYIVFEHMPPEYRQNPQMFELGQMMSGVTWEGKSNPYFIGVEIWKGIREDFNQRPEIVGLTPFERDHAFIKYAEKLIGDPNFGNNISFILYKMKDSWIKNRHLALVKKFSREEARKAIQDGKVPQPQSYDADLYQVITHDPDRIRKSFMNDWNFHRVYPFITWKNLHDQDDDVARFEVGNQIGLVNPINRQSLAPSLLMWAKILRKRVELEATLLVRPMREYDHGEGFIGPVAPGRGGPVVGYHLARVKVSVDVKGNIEVVPLKNIVINKAREEYGMVPSQTGYFTYETKKIPASLDITDIDESSDWYVAIKNTQEKILGLYLQAFSEDYNLDRPDHEGRAIVDITPSSEKAQKNSDLLRQSLSSQTGALASEMSMADIPPGVLRALTAYEQKVGRRIYASVLRSLKGKPLTPGKGGVRVKVLPSSPGISFDRSAQAQIKKILSQVPDHPDNPYDMDDGLIFMGNHLRDGSYYWQDKQDGQGQGDGDGGEEGEEEGEATDEESEEQSKKPEPGEGKGGGDDPTYVDIPLDLYHQIIAEELELPNLRPLDGESERMTRVRVGSQVGDRRPLVVKRTAKRLYALGIAALGLEEEEGADVSDRDVIEAGTHVAGKTDLYTKASRMKPDPDISAHITIIADNSGSMGDELPKLRNMIFNLRMLLKKKYKQIIFTYIAFDGKAHVFEDHEEDKFFKVQLGGGTDYAIGTEKAIEVQEKFPELQYDRFAFMMGDLYESHSDRVAAATEKLKGQSRFFGVVKFPIGWGAAPGQSTGPLEDYYADLSRKDEFAGFVEVEPGPDFDVLKVFKTLFKTEDKK
jgi:uncharacterized sporulation protein YeaH/YhbH (DUF444 family)/spore cortex formation protein SpoVR/YcgB (stage V sporulation)